MADKDTKFASPERSLPELLSREKEIIVSQQFFTKTLNTFPEIILVLDKNRQIVFFNKQLMNTLNLTEAQVIGKRPGELLGCIHSAEEKAGCGTSSSCKACGAVSAILSAQSGIALTEDCCIKVTKDGKERSMDLRASATPFDIGNDRFTVFTVKNIADEKRREVLERTFFHDILNNISVLCLFVENMADNLVPRNDESLKLTQALVRSVADEIQAQRDLLAAERGQLKAFPVKFSVREFLDEIITVYRPYASEKDVSLSLSKSENVYIMTDKSLLGRVITNLVKNAIEATSDGSTITIAHEVASGKNLFSVHNPEVIPEMVKLNIFQRSFSTKGRGRGIGTYSVKFFTDNYLGGKAWFISEDGKGTTFYVELPEKIIST